MVEGANTNVNGQYDYETSSSRWVRTDESMVIRQGNGGWNFCSASSGVVTDICLGSRNRRGYVGDNGGRPAQSAVFDWGSTAGSTISFQIVNAVDAAMTQVNLKVEVAPGSEYRANDGTSINGLSRNKVFGQINIGGRAGLDFPAGSSINEATFIFTLLDHSTNLPVVGLKYFAFSYFDFDHSGNGYAGRECLTLQEPAQSQYNFAAGSAIAQSVSSNVPKFCSTRWGTNQDNPADPTDIGAVKETAVTFEFRDTNVMKVTYSVACCLGTGRSFLFAGTTAPLMPCETPPSAPPSPQPPPLATRPPATPPARPTPARETRLSPRTCHPVLLSGP